LNTNLRNLTHLTINNCLAPQGSAKGIAEIVKNNSKTLKEVEFQTNLLGDQTLHIVEQLQGCTEIQVINFSDIDFGQVQHKKLEDALIPLLSSTALPIKSINLNNTKCIITHNIIKAFIACSSLEDLQLKNVNVVPGFEEWIGLLLTERSVQKKPLLNIALSKVSLDALKDAVKEQLYQPQTGV